MSSSSNNRRRRRRRPHGDYTPHRNSQHVLAVSLVENTADDVLQGIRVAFEKTSQLPSSFLAVGNVLFGSNYPDCLLESEDFAILCGGFPYNFHAAFDDVSDKNTNNNKANAHDFSFASCILKLARSLLPCDTEKAAAINTTTLLQDIQQAIGQRLVHVSGHFSVMLCHKHSETLLVWNDPFGFMPLFFATTSSCIALSSYWDCLVYAPDFGSLSLNWNIVAEYLTLGTTLGGTLRSGRLNGSGTFCHGIQNALPGTNLLIHCDGCGGDVRHRSSSRIVAVEQHRYTRCYGACDLVLSEAIPIG